VACVLASQHLLQLFDLPSGLVVDDNRLATADRVMKWRFSVANRSRDTFIFPGTTHQVGCFVVEGCEYVVAILVAVNATPFADQIDDGENDVERVDQLGDGSSRRNR
jgi:hypothetical protein